jgi:hypothetical protein
MDGQEGECFYDIIKVKYGDSLLMFDVTPSKSTELISILLLNNWNMLMSMASLLA